jgi:SAM-dependent MidA family methyltransferase
MRRRPGSTTLAQAARDAIRAAATPHHCGMQTADLPPLDSSALAHSARVARAVREAIAEGDGWIPFARYMEIALHAPGLGYYAAGAAKLGAAGDFTTAPEMTTLFGAALATQVEAILRATTGRDILELGAGTGRLARDLLLALGERGALPTRYAILELSPDLASRQRATLQPLPPEVLSRVEWLATLPAAIDGAILANEVLDAVPVHLVRRQDGRYLERGVDEDERQGTLAWADRPAPEWLAALARKRFPAAGDYASEINPGAEALVEELGRILVRGAVLLIDYGFGTGEYYHPQRDMGTLVCHYRHRVHHDPLRWPGLCDITAHVDFGAIAEAGERAGLEVAGFAAQAPFLLGCGVLERLAATGAPDSTAYIRAASAVQQLLSPAEMGELFKVLALARGDGIDWPGFAVVDRRHRLG